MGKQTLIFTTETKKMLQEKIKKDYPGCSHGKMSALVELALTRYLFREGQIKTEKIDSISLLNRYRKSGINEKEIKSLFDELGLNYTVDTNEKKDKKNMNALKYTSKDSSKVTLSMKYHDVDKLLSEISYEYGWGKKSMMYEASTLAYLTRIGKISEKEFKKRISEYGMNENDVLEFSLMAGLNC